MEKPPDSLPKGFVPISAVRGLQGKLVNIIGIIADFRPAKLSRGTDYTITFTLCDRTAPKLDEGLNIRVFRGGKDLLPQIQGVGDVIVIWDLKVSQFNGSLTGLTSHTTSWTVGCPSSITQKLNFTPSSPMVKLSQEEAIAIKSLQEFWKIQVGAPARGIAHGTIDPAKARRKFSYIKDMQFDCFYDIMGEVVKTFPGNSNFTIYITDYTKNPNLFCYGWSEGIARSGEDDDGYDYTGRRRSGGGVSNWTGPAGQYTLQITLWDVHAAAARKFVKENCLVRLKNVRAKKNGDGKLEGALHGDRLYPDRVDVEVVKDLSDPSVKLLKQRKIEALRRQEQERQDYLAQQEEKLKQRKAVEEEEKKVVDTLNKNIRTMKSDSPLLDLGDIVDPPFPMDAPFTNTNYRTICRVLDFIPHKLEQFSVPKPQKPYRTYCSRTGRMMLTLSNGKTKYVEDTDEVDDFDEDEYDNGSQVTKWEWRFALLVEGTDGATMKLMVGNESAQFLLNQDASDLANSPDDLDLLREKLFVLWGDLEERKTRRLRKALESAEKDPQNVDNKQQNKRKRKKGKGNKNNNQNNSNSNKRMKVAGGSDTSNNSAAEADGDDSDGEDEGGLVVGRGKFFEACVREYGVKKVRNGEEMWERMFMLFGVRILWDG